MREFDMTPEMLVCSEDLMAANAAVNREGLEAAVARLRAREPVLTKYLFDEWNEVYQQLGRQPQVPQRCRNMRQKLTLAIVVAMTASAKGQYRLWRETAMGTRLMQIDPTLAE